ncbi:MAG: GFA family protein [Deltaproteobacteria bacterium]|nr:GFA family protein [Deltaproteobacteria bacterium]
MSVEHEHKPIPGSCFCGAVQFEIELPTAFCGHCHCSMCRRVHGAGYVTWIAVPYSQFRMVAGNEHLKVYHSSDHGWRSFCDVCSSSLFCESTHHPEVIDIVLANINGKIDRDPQSHFYFSDRVEWAPSDDELPRFGGVSGAEPLGGK